MDDRVLGADSGPTMGTTTTAHGDGGTAMTLRLWKQPLEFDIGHGLNNTGAGVYDPGAVSGGKQEHKVVETFVDALVAKARALGAVVTISHDKPLRSRRAISGSDSTSWHLDAGGGHGVGVFVSPFAGPKSRARSDKMGRAIAAALELPYRGMKRAAHLFVLGGGAFDRLIEIIFITNAVDLAHFTNRHDAAVDAFLAVFPDTSPAPVVVKVITPTPNRVVIFVTAFIRLTPDVHSTVLAIVHKSDKLTAIPGGTLLWALTTRGFILRTRIRKVTA
jgi:hypothetical protein